MPLKKSIDVKMGAFTAFSEIGDASSLQKTATHRLSFAKNMPLDIIKEMVIVIYYEQLLPGIPSSSCTEEAKMYSIGFDDL